MMASYRWHERISIITNNAGDEGIPQFTDYTHIFTDDMIDVCLSYHMSVWRVLLIQFVSLF